jgi:ribosome-binding factor A
MEEWLARARAADADVARVREGASPAGDADPYRLSGAEQDDENMGAPTANGEGAGDDDEFED